MVHHEKGSIESEVEDDQDGLSASRKHAPARSLDVVVAEQRGKDEMPTDPRHEDPWSAVSSTGL